MSLTRTLSNPNKSQSPSNKLELVSWLQSEAIFIVGSPRHVKVVWPMCLDQVKVLLFPMSRRLFVTTPFDCGLACNGTSGKRARSKSKVDIIKDAKSSLNTWNYAYKGRALQAVYYISNDNDTHLLTCKAWFSASISWKSRCYFQGVLD